jgi:prepilin-type N-terminal cleavage/methylation domain-containing protein
MPKFSQFEHKETLKKIINKVNKGFTLAEALVTLVIVGVVTAITVPILIVTATDQTDVLYRQAYRITEKAVNQLVNDTTLYPMANLSPSGFACLFYNKFNNITPTCSPASATVAYPYATGYVMTPEQPLFVSTNGMRWYLGNQGPTQWNVDGQRDILVDVNGAKGPDTVGQDVLRITILNTGKVTATTEPEITYLTQ